MATIARAAALASTDAGAAAAARSVARWDDRDLDAVAATLNSTPRQTLGWRTPAEALDKQPRSLHQTLCDDRLRPPTTPRPSSTPP